MSKTSYRKSSNASNRRRSSASSEKRLKTSSSNTGASPVQSDHASGNRVCEINFQDELVLLLYNSLLETIVEEWESIAPPDDELTSSKFDEDDVVTKSFKDISVEDMSQNQIVGVEGSKVSLSKKKSRKSQSGSKILTKSRSSDSKKSPKDLRRRRSSEHSQGSKKKGSGTSLVNSASNTVNDMKQSASVTHSVEVASHESAKSLNFILKTEDEYVRIKFTNGNVYTGQVSRKVMHGTGHFRWADGTFYEGEFKDGYPTGIGRMVLSNLCDYRGHLYKGLFYGEGVMYITGTPMLYFGTWKYGTKHGKGWLLYDTGNWYDGEWCEDLRHGQGLRNYPSGAVYKGMWQNGLQSGQGTMVWHNNDFYKGEWQNGLRHGYGEYTWNAFYNNTLTFPLENQYLGSWVSGQRHGVGIIHFGVDGGSKMAGIWQNNFKHGPGVLICGNGFTIEKNPLFVKDKPVHMHFTPNQFGSKSQMPRRKSTTSSLQLIASQVNTKRPSRNVSSSVLRAISESHHELRRSLCDPIDIPVHSAAEQVDFTFFLKQLSAEFDKRECQCFKCPAYMDSSVKSETSHDFKCELFVVTRQYTNIERNSNVIDNISDKLYFVNYEIEDKELRNLMTVNLAKLEQIYYTYATISSTGVVNFKPVLVRMFLWQFWRDIGVLKDKLSCIDIDLLLDTNPGNGFETIHYPFEKIYFWQFLQALVAVSWHLHLKAGKVTVNKRGGILAGIFRKFLDDFVLQPIQYTRASSLFEYKNLLPLQSVYLFYRSMGEPHTARQFLKNSCVKKGFRAPCFLKSLDRTYKKCELGTNSVVVGNNIMYMSCCQPDLGERPEEISLVFRKDAFFKELVTFRNLGTKKVTECLAEVCPGIMKDGLIVNMEYPLTFLEFYEVLILCAFHTIDKKFVKQDIPEAKAEINDPAHEESRQNVQKHSSTASRTKTDSAKKGAKKGHKKSKSK